MNPRLFADESDNNAAVFSATQYRDAGLRVIAEKATQGLTITQPPYVTRVAAAHAAGLQVVHYHFADPKLGQPANQIDFFLKTIAPHFKRGDRAVLDIEWEADTPSETTRWARAAFARLASKGHPGAPLYTGASFLLSHGSAIVPPSRALWIADYPAAGVSPAQISRYLSSTAKHVGGWLWAAQFTDGVQGPGPHRLPGIREHSDVSLLSTRAYLGLRFT